jgi:hypothetical protein
MSPTEQESISYTDALFRLNDLCGSRVKARVCEPDSQILAVEGTLTHDKANGTVWGCYFVGEAELDLTGFQAYERHWASPSGEAVSLHGDGVRVDIWKLREGGE